MDQASDKIALRQQLRQVLRSLPPDQRHVKSLAACRQVIQSPEFAASKVVMLYLSMSQEVDTAAIALRAWQEGKTVVVPKVFLSDRTMLPVEIQSLDTEMRTTPVGVREPAVGQPIPIDCIDLVLVPGLGFSPTGQRIGRGGGFYDRFLAQTNFQGVTCGLAFEEQVIQTLPMLPHDQHLNMLVTDTGIRRFHPAAAAPAAHPAG
jgi:5-formyltetrahydrofolate cyclo-ligase